MACLLAYITLRILSKFKMIDGNVDDYSHFIYADANGIEGDEKFRPPQAYAASCPSDGRRDTRRSGESAEARGLWCGYD